MTRQIIPRDLAARELAISTTVLARYESLGLIHVTHEGTAEGYEPEQIRRLWSIVTYQRDLGINLAGIEMILQLRDHLSDVHYHVHDLAEALRALLDQADSSPTSDSDV